MNHTLSSLSLSREKYEDTYEITPWIDGRSLVDLVLDFEASRGYRPSGGYSGLLPAYENFEPLAQYFAPSGESAAKRIWVLGCNCGIAGCWPLECAVASDAGVVVWHEFKQPHRPEWDYSAFGPFYFAEPTYLEVLAALP